MATPIRMPDVGTVEGDVVLSRWLKKEGQAVRVGEPLLEVETDKGVNEIESVADGVLLRRIAVEGAKVPRRRADRVDRRRRRVSARCGRRAGSRDSRGKRRGGRTGGRSPRPPGPRRFPGAAAAGREARRRPGSGQGHGPRRGRDQG